MPTLKKNVKALIRAIEEVTEARRPNYNPVIGALQEFGTIPASTHLINALKVQESKETIYYKGIRDLILTPLRQHYEVDIKQGEERKRDWAQRSSTYYASVQRYLVKAKHSKKHSAGSDAAHCGDESQLVDAKFGARKAAFEADRMTYACYLLEVNDLLRKRLPVYCQAFVELLHARQLQEDGKDFEDLKEEIVKIQEDLISSTSKREEQVRKCQNKRDVCIIRWHSQVLGQHQTHAPSMEHAGTEPTMPTNNEHREGFLYASNKSALSKTHWHRYWCTLSMGFLHEYHFDLHQEEEGKKPSLRLHQSHSLALCTVRASGGHNAGNAANISYQGRRRFCFELVSAQGWLRVYQAVSEDEQQSWIAAIQVQITGWLEGRHGSVLMGNSEPEPKSSIDSSMHEELMPQRMTGELLTNLWQVDEANMRCADCSSPKPDWCSINLGCLLCIECAGVHRSLGSHLSKIRSLRLDTQTFTPEILDLLYSTGNRVANAIWEACKPASLHIPPDAARPAREAFIRSKYEDRAFCVPTRRHSLDDHVERASPSPQQHRRLSLGSHDNKA
jgi:Arf-GAP with SH3 domain, ANK repeat and PH domain-containing protein